MLILGPPSGEGDTNLIPGGINMQTRSSQPHPPPRSPKFYQNLSGGRFFETGGQLLEGQDVVGVVRASDRQLPRGQRKVQSRHFSERRQRRRRFVVDVDEWRQEIQETIFHFKSDRLGAELGLDPVKDERILKYF